MTFSICSPSEAEQVWNVVVWYLDKACEHSEDTTAQLLELLSDPHSPARLVTINEGHMVCGAMVLQINGSDLHIRALAGDLPDGWTDELDTWLVKVAGLMRLARVSLEGRKGWRRRLRSLGWYPDGNLVVREV